MGERGARKNKERFTDILCPVNPEGSDQGKIQVKSHKNLTVLDTTQSKANNQAKIVNNWHSEIHILVIYKERGKNTFSKYVSA